MKPVFKVILMAVAYLATFILGASSGAIHPACYAYIGALLPVIFAFIYLYTVIENIPVMIAVLVLTVPVAMLSMRLAERSLKK